MNWVYFLFLFNVIFISAQEGIEIKKDTMENLDIPSMKAMLELEYENIDSGKPIDQKNIGWLNSEILKALLKSGYKQPTQEEFKTKIQKIFSINPNGKENCKWKKIDDKNIMIYGAIFIRDKKLGINQEPRSEYVADYNGNILFLFGNQFMSFLMSPVRVVDFAEDSTSYKVKIPQYIISRNKYLFNDDKSQFPWLVNNDADFMESLVTHFGYIQDKKLLNWVMEKNKSNAENFIKNSVFVKDCQGNLEIREGILQYIEDNTNENDNTYYNALESFGYNIGYNKDIKKNEKVKIIAFIANTLSPLFYKYTQLNGNAIWKPGTMLYNLSVSNENLISEIEKNNYYNLPNLKEVIENLEEEAPPLPAD